jgi:hypothetical protein
MADQKTTASEQLAPHAKPGEVGLSSNVLRELDSKTHPSIAARIKEHLARKGGGTPPGR